MKDKGLLLVHANQYYDENHIKDKIIEALEEFNGKTYELPENGLPSYGKEKGLYDQVLEEEEDGKLKMKDAINLTIKHDKMLLGGGFARGCMKNTYNSLKKARNWTEEDTEIRVVPEISYERYFTFSNLSGFKLNEIFTLEDVKDRDLEDLPTEISEYFQEEDIESIL